MNSHRSPGNPPFRFPIPDRCCAVERKDTTESESIPGCCNLTIVVHGPEPFDTGDVARICEVLGPLEIIVAGVMGRTAAEESGIPHTWSGETPSTVLGRFLQNQTIFLVNHGKTPQSGRIFGELVANKLPVLRGLVHVECSDSTIYVWNGGDRTLAEHLQSSLKFHVCPLKCRNESSNGSRKIRGCIPGEPVFINGIIIGRATSGTVILESENGRIKPVSGLVAKPHGIEKLNRLGPVDVSAAWCKSGVIRKKNAQTNPKGTRRGQIMVVDHAGHQLYQKARAGICGVLCIGDDTTAVCGHICAHLGIPVLGIVDGDADGIIKPDFAPGSVIVKVLEGRDDDVGATLIQDLDETSVDWEPWVNETVSRLEKCQRIAVTRIGDRDAVRRM